MASNSGTNAQPTSSTIDPTAAGPARSRGASVSSQNVAHQHRPSVPSRLSQAHQPPSSPDEPFHFPRPDHDTLPEVSETGIHPFAQDWASISSDPSDTKVQGEIEDSPDPPTAQTKLLGDGQKYHVPHKCGHYNCNHGAFSPRPRYGRGYGSIASSFDGSAMGQDDRSQDGYGGTLPAEPADMDDRSYIEGSVGNAVTDGLLGKPGKRSTTHWLARRHGVRHERWMYFLYYVPGINWMRQYRASYLTGDLTAALTMASFYIPMSLSYASNLGHVPPINGLYTFVFNPLIYALLGTCPQMVVGPEAAGSLLTGSVVKEAIKRGTHYEHEDQKHAQVAGMVTGLAGGIILLAGLCRLGFLDGVLSRPFLRGFISAIGIVILVDQLIPEMGLNTVAKGSQAASHGSSLDKILFLFRHGHEAHKLTCIVSFTTIAIVMVMRELKRRLQPRTPWVAYIPDRFAVVVLSAVFAWKFDWESKGLALMGDIRSKGRPFEVHSPFVEDNFKHVDDAFSTAFIIALLGFFESSVAAKSLGASSGGKTTRTVKDKDGNEVEEADGLKDMPLSANRELVALGVANLFGGLFMALPGFGGYGRSKVNASTGGRTPMSSVFLSLITIVCIEFLMEYFYYIPKGTLSAMITIVAYSLIEEAPHDIHFFWQISGYSELLLMLLIFTTTFLWNLKIGIAVGIGLSLLRLLRHSTRPRIQILGRVPGTQEFENAEHDGVEMVPHCLIIKVPEPLTFANTGSLKDRLRRLEDHGTGAAHPALPKVRRKEHNKNVIFDVHGVTSMDPAAAQVLLEIVQAYVERGTSVFFCRVPGRRTEVWRLMGVSGIVECCGGEGRFLRSVDEALRATERESTLNFGSYEGDVEAEGESGDGIRSPGRPVRRSVDGGDEQGRGNG
ncbi:uncharacterized protein LTR77_000964 [Saxophila tyrrhenica]|uniref:STAS domain-containing protein n=1 Tax=Saxophila tyrrhenica TaxID=1690608 RepID=A0AAV9PS19_9PEZI|nr:hypothetical protein LTR77_000964 [Saxophila tyrrhenica]